MYSNIISFFFIEVKPMLDKCNVKILRKIPFFFISVLLLLFKPVITYIRFFLSVAYLFNAQILMNEKNSQIYKIISYNCQSVLFSHLMNDNEIFMKEILLT